MTVIDVPGQIARPRVFDPRDRVLFIGKVDLRKTADADIWTDAHRSLDLGAAKGYASMEDAVRAASRLTAGPTDSTALVFGHKDRFFLQGTFESSGERDMRPFELGADPRERQFKWSSRSSDVLALVNGDTVLQRPADGRPKAGLPWSQPDPR